MKGKEDKTFQNMIQYSKMIDSGVKKLRNASISSNPFCEFPEATNKDDFLQSITSYMMQIKEESQQLFGYLTNESSFGKQLDLVEEGLNTLHRYAQFLKIEPFEIPNRIVNDQTVVHSTVGLSIESLTPNRSPSPFLRKATPNIIQSQSVVPIGSYRPVTKDEEKALPPAVKLLFKQGELNEKYKLLCDLPDHSFTLIQLQQIFSVSKCRVNALVVGLSRLGRMETIGEGDSMICNLL